MHVYDQALTLGHVPPGAPLARALMLVLNSVNRLASTILLTGGITPIVAAGLIGTISWTRWFVLMSVPYVALLALAAAAIYLRYRHGFRAVVRVPPREPRPLSGVEVRTALITAGAGALWLTDSLHHWHPTLPALLAWVCFLMPRVGVTWAPFGSQTSAIRAGYGVFYDWYESGLYDQTLRVDGISVRDIRISCDGGNGYCADVANLDAASADRTSVV